MWCLISVAITDVRSRKMNKNTCLLEAPLGAAALASTSSAMALTFTDGGFTGSIDIRNIVPQTQNNRWERSEVQGAYRHCE